MPVPGRLGWNPWRDVGGDEFQRIADEVLKNRGQQDHVADRHGERCWREDDALAFLDFGFERSSCGSEDVIQGDGFSYEPFASERREVEQIGNRTARLRRHTDRVFGFALFSKTKCRPERGFGQFGTNRCRPLFSWMCPPAPAAENAVTSWSNSDRL